MPRASLFHLLDFETRNIESRTPKKIRASDYDIDSNSSIPREAGFRFEFVTEFGFFEVEGDREEDIR